MNWVLELARPEIRALRAYQHAAWEPQLERLHANELPWRVAGDSSAAGLNRYPEPQPPPLVQGMAALYGVRPECVLVGRGSDEAIDVLMRVFCRAGKDRIIVCPPTFGMYGVAARIQGAEVVAVPLLAERGFSLDIDGILAQATESTRLVFVCSPNNPTGNLVPRAQLRDLAQRLAPRALLVVDEAYVEFAEGPGITLDLPTLPNLCVLRTLSKAHGLAGARCGALLAHPDIIALARKVIPPYAIAEMTVEVVTPLLAPTGVAAMHRRIAEILTERQRVALALARVPGVLRVWPSDANFLLVDFAAPDAVLARIRDVGLIVRDVRQPALPQSLRITIGTPEQNNRLLGSLE
ncbi:MAG: histidinol-phosphate transaminase [Pseudomonadota bacterium]